MYTSLKNSLPNFSINILKSVTRKYTSLTLNETENAFYPPILDLSYKAKVKRKNEEWHNKIKKLETVEEKLIGINMPRYYGWKSLNLKEGFVPYNSLQHAQYITHTHVINNNKLPEFYDTIITPEKINALVQIIKQNVENIIIFEYNHRLKEQEITEEVDGEKKKLLQNAITKALVFQINRIILTVLSSTTPHLLETEIDFEPRVEAFWFAGGIEHQHLSKIPKLKSEFLKERLRSPVTIPVQYVGSPILQLRHQFPLREIFSLNQSLNPELLIPEFRFDPRVLGYKFTYKHATCIPGFWPGDPSEFGLLSYHNLNDLTFNSLLPLTEEAITVQAIFSSYSWLLSQACYQGFSTVNDITYPLVSQTILTNGQYWSFCVYQLNTTLVHSEYADNNLTRNICWITQPIMLFDKVENGKIYGFNEDVLKQLITFYMNTPVKKNENMKPYLGDSVKYLADITEIERRVWLEKLFKHLMSNRPRHFKIPEMYHWQKIYIVDNNTRALDKKRDPWQFGYNPYKRRLDDHKPVYVPKCLRENPKKKRVGRAG